MSGLRVLTDWGAVCYCQPLGPDSGLGVSCRSSCLTAVGLLDKLWFILFHFSINFFSCSHSVRHSLGLSWRFTPSPSSSSSSVFYDSSRNQRRWRAVYTFTTLPHASLPSPHSKAICFEVFLTKKTRSLRIDSPLLSSVFLPASSSFVQVHRCHLSLLYPHGGSEWNFIFRCYSRVNLRPGRTVEQHQSCTVPGQGRQSHGAFLGPGSWFLTLWLSWSSSLRGSVNVHTHRQRHTHTHTDR